MEGRCGWAGGEHGTQRSEVPGRLWGALDIKSTRRWQCPVRRVECPPFRHGPTMPSVKVRENEPFDVALRRFKRSCEKAGVISEVRRREFYEKPTAVRKRKAAAAVKRHIKKLQREARRFEKAF